MFVFVFQKNKTGGKGRFEHMFFSVCSFVLGTVLNDYDVYLVKFRHNSCELLLVTEHAQYVTGSTAPLMQ
jgi:hypothetical protein